MPSIPAFQGRNASASTCVSSHGMMPQPPAGAAAESTLKKYAGIVRLARKINSQLRGYTGSSDAMENRICHLLLGIHYKSYLDNGDIHHIDHAINSIF